MYSNQLKSLISELIAQEPVLKPIFNSISIDQLSAITDKAVEIATRQGYLDDRVSKPQVVNSAAQFIDERDENGA